MNQDEALELLQRDVCKNAVRNAPEAIRTAAFFVEIAHEMTKQVVVPEHIVRVNLAMAKEQLHRCLQFMSAKGFDPSDLLVHPTTPGEQK